MRCAFEFQRMSLSGLGLGPLRARTFSRIGASRQDYPRPRDENRSLKKEVDWLCGALRFGFLTQPPCGTNSLIRRSSPESCCSYPSRWSSRDFSIGSLPPLSTAFCLNRSMPAAATPRRLIFSPRVHASVHDHGLRMRSATSNSSGGCATLQSSSSQVGQSTRRGRAISVMPWTMWFRTSNDRHSCGRQRKQHQPTLRRSRRTTTLHPWESTFRAAVRANDRRGDRDKVIESASRHREHGRAALECVFSY